MARLETIASQIKRGATVFGFGSLIGFVSCNDSSSLTDYAKDTRINNDIEIKILVDSEVLEKRIQDGALVNIDINVEDVNLPTETALTVRYFMQDATSSLRPTDGNRFYQSLVYLGERSDLVLDASGKAAISGFFDYDHSLLQAFEQGTALVNPHAAFPAANEFYFYVEIWHAKQKLDHKFWGENTPDPEKYVFRYEEDGNEDKDSEGTSIKRINGPKKIFIYEQALGSKRMHNEAMAVADYYHPHMYELRDTNKGLVLKQRVGEKIESSILNIVRSHGIKVLPMASAFSAEVIIDAIENPSQTAKLIAKEIRDEGYDGVAIDFESIRIGQEQSARLVDFMRLLRRELPKKDYETAIAVSPRFDGSAQHGYKHHGFYDLTALAPHVDFIELMAYDFHKGRRGPSPVMPKDRLDDIVAYAKAHLPSEKIVVLFPLYGGVWKQNGSFIGTLSARNTGEYLRKAKTRSYDNGELRIVTNNGRVAYAQDETTFEERLDYLGLAGIQNAGAWRQTHGTTAIFKKFGEYKANSSE